MKRLLPLLLGCSVLFCGCNGVGDKETLAIRVDNENIYKEDIDLLQKTMRVDRSDSKFAEHVAALVTESAVTLEALKKFPQLENLYEKRGRIVDDGLLAYVYQNFHVVENLQIPEAELRSYYYKHQNEFDSTKSFVELRNDVAKSIYLQQHKPEFDEFVAKKLKDAAHPASATISYAVTDSSSAYDIQRKWASGDYQNVSAIVMSSVVEEDKAEGIFSQPEIFASLFATDSKSDGWVGVFKLTAPGDSFAVIKMVSFVERVIPDVAKVSAEAPTDFINESLQNIFGISYYNLVDKYKIVAETIVPPHMEEYYESHREKFMNSAMMDVYEIESADSISLEKLISSGTLTFDYFVQNGTHLGLVKEGHALPSGLGLVPELFRNLKDKPDSSVSSVIRSKTTSKYYVFCVAAHVAPQLKSYDRVKNAVANSVLNSRNVELDSDYVLVTMDGKPVLRERDLLQLYSEDENLERTNMNRTRMVKSLMQSFAFAAEARNLKLDHSWEFKALKRRDRINFINSKFKRLLFSDPAVTDDSLAVIFKQHGNPVKKGRSLRKSKDDIMDMLLAPANLVKYEFYNSPFLMEGKTPESQRPYLFRLFAEKYRKDRWDRLVNDLMLNTNVTIYDQAYNVPLDFRSVERWFQIADSLYKAGNLSESLESLRKVRGLYADVDSVFAKASLEIARIASEKEDFATAEKEYSIFCDMWPESPEVEKAMFSRGFILTENLHRDDMALETLQEFQKKFPKSELKESVDWLVDNIKSEGKLAADLLKKISAEE